MDSKSINRAISRIALVTSHGSRNSNQRAVDRVGKFRPVGSGREIESVTVLIREHSRAEHTEDIARVNESHHLRITEERTGLKTSKALMLNMLFCHTACLECLATHKACLCTPSQDSSRKPPTANCSNWVFFATSRVADCTEKGPATPFLPNRMFLKYDLDFCVIYPWGRAASEGVAR